MRHPRNFGSRNVATSQATAGDGSTNRRLGYPESVRTLGVALAFSATACSFSAPVPGNVPGDGPIDPDATDAPIAIDAAPDAPLDAVIGPGRKKLVTIPDASVTGDLADFPVWVTLTDNQLRNRALADGSDIHFTTLAGAPLAYQLQRWDKATGHLEAWVRISVPDAGTQFFVRYGDATTAHVPTPASVFSASFNAVWHLDDALATQVVADARGAHPGTAIGGLDATNQVPARVGGGISFDGSDDEITFANDLGGNGSHTISAWVSADPPVGNSFSSILTIGNSMTNRSRWFHTSFPDVAVGFFGNDFLTTGVNIDGDGLTLVHWVYDASTRVSRIYVDGALAATSLPHSTGINTSGSGGHIGSAPGPWGAGGNTPNPLKGILDEVRIATAVRDLPWIAAEFANQSAPTTFYTVGNEQLAP